MTTYRYEIDPRPNLGGGWRLRLIEQCDGVDIEMGGGVFPSERTVPTERTGLSVGTVPFESGLEQDAAYADAVQTGEDWLASRPEGGEVTNDSNAL